VLFVTPTAKQGCSEVMAGIGAVVDRASALVLAGTIAILAVVVLLCLLGDDWHREPDGRRSSERRADRPRRIPITLSWASDPAPSTRLDEGASLSADAAGSAPV
jgi:hypothetical protein